MDTPKPRLSTDGLSIELENGRRFFVDDVLAEARRARATEVRSLIIAASRWLWRQATAIRATAADRATELPGNSFALAVAAGCRDDTALGHFAGAPTADGAGVAAARQQLAA